MQRKLRNLSRQAPLTPSIPESVTNLVTHTRPDLKVEAALYRALQYERQRNARLTRQIEAQERVMANWRAKKAAKFLARELAKKGRV